MKEPITLVKNRVFPRDNQTKSLIYEIEMHLGLKHKNIDEMPITLINEYIESITMEFRKKY